MHQQRFASVLASKGRSLVLWTTPLALTAAVGMAVGGCPGPDPQTIGSGGSGPGTSSVGTSSTGSRGGSSDSSSSTSASTGTGQTDGGCATDGEVCDGGCLGDVNNCGKCGNACATTNVTQALCMSGICQLTCADKYVNIDPLMNPNCDTPAKRVFITSMTVNSKFGSSLGGVHAANQFCNQLAPADGAMWVAWVAVADQTPITTILSGPQVAYVLMDMQHSLVTTTMDLLAGAALRHRIDTTESGVSLQSNSPLPVWTGANGNGMATGSDCAGWSSTTTSTGATVGDWSATGPTWSNSGQPTDCGAYNRVYCFEK